MTTMQGTYNDYSESIKISPIYNLVYDQPWNSNISSPMAYATLNNMPITVPNGGSSGGSFKGSNKFIIRGTPNYDTLPFIGIPNGSPPYFPDEFKGKENILVKIQERDERLYNAISYHEGFISPISSRAGMFTNIIPSNTTLSDFYRTRDLSIFLPSQKFISSSSSDKNLVTGLLNSTIKRKISPSEFGEGMTGVKREQTILGQYILLKLEKRQLYIAFSFLNTYEKDNVQGWSDLYNDQLVWRKIKNFIHTTNGYIYFYDSN